MAIRGLSFVTAVGRVPFPRPRTALQSPLVRIDDEQRALLDKAMIKAQRLVDDLTAQQADLERNPPKISTADLVAGRAALENALASARRMLVALREAEQIANRDDERAP